MARLVDPVRVSGWFRPPAQPVLAPTGKHTVHSLPLTPNSQTPIETKAKQTNESPTP
jgi:hypothetical protein